jgi:hypothetical protein
MIIFYEALYLVESTYTRQFMVHLQEFTDLPVDIEPVFAF